MNRRRFVLLGASAGAGLTGGLLVYGGLVERRDVEVRRVRLEPSVTGTSGTPDPTADVLTVVQLSDLHMSAFSSFHESVARTVREAEPDLIVLTGDSVDDPDRVDDFGRFLDLLPGRVPLLAVPGNWEYWGGVPLRAEAAALADRGGRLLVNESARLRVAGQDVLVTGVDDLVAGDPDLATALLGAEPAPIHLVLAHCPAHREQLAIELDTIRRRRREEGSRPIEPSIVLSGHTHGGQVDLLGLRITPPGSGPYVEGLYDGGPLPLYVSRGLGTSVVPLRIGARPEVTVLEVATG